MRIKSTTSSILAAWLFFSIPNAYAENLNDIFALARKNDPEWASKKQKYLGDREKLEQAFGSMMPTAELTGNWSQNRYEGGSTALTLDNAIECGIANGTFPPTVGTDFIDFLSGCQDDAVGFTDVTEDFQKSSYNFTATQPLLRMDRWHRYKRAQSLDNASKAELALGQQELMIRSAEAYFGVLRSEEELRLTQSEEKTLRAQLTEIKNRYKLGLLRDTDVYELQAQHDIAKAAVIVAETAVVNIKDTLAMLTGKDIQTVTPLPKDIPIEPPQPAALSEWEEFAAKSNYQLIASQYLVEAAEKERKEMKAAHAPTADLFLNYNHSDSSGSQSTPSSDLTTIGVRVSLPLYTGGITSSQVRESEHRLQESRYNSELARRNALRETRQFHSQVNADVASVQARLRAVKSNNSSLRAVKAGWQDGIRSMSDALAAQRSVYQARKEYTIARYEYIMDTLKLKKAAGVLTPDDLQTLNTWLDSPSSQTVSTILEEEDNFLDQVDDIKFERELKTFDDEKKAASKKQHKSLYDAFKDWRDSE
ncbi:TolC family outer membrane protein [Ketobacter sp. MCCC 1A13808]|uniref:TolC family outer membrane protein n=1 Tax=Ketobacter sp. MCCC 1A13808 TaxID=2602738 RepID=UPI0012EB28B9|nr:TolC family outer membrane protein [Ketobacter sp. MCCC 1A13808]MVF12551.1 TolC family outer membrane protein [Ketobacter sp. MCCC 1A13808]